ncbi:pentapeptide repeat-containing protein [Actinokineospora sp. HUAS TT18]|uniref:pentapeptide repeat-containing protein n=1 Tax=Actinokineospora sp. HUAS TT18 TaxID=3447451 RepID=UPI003F51D319
MTDLSHLRADCSRCAALCCVGLAFAKSADFALDKPAGRPCVNLLADHRCGIHTRLRDSGFQGCTVYECFGAGQQVVQVTFGGRTWRDPAIAQRQFDAFGVLRVLHELLWYLTDARTFAPTLAAELDRAYAETTRLAASDADTLLALDVAAHRHAVNQLLIKASDQARAGLRAKRRKPDLIGANLRRADLRGASLRGALLIAADLREADLTRADVIGADFRDTRVHGADLTGALFLTQVQLNAAKGDAATRIPARLARPAHW